MPKRTARSEATGSIEKAQHRTCRTRLSYSHLASFSFLFLIFFFSFFFFFFSHKVVLAAIVFLYYSVCDQFENKSYPHRVVNCSDVTDV